MVCTNCLGALLKTAEFSRDSDARFLKNLELMTVVLILAVRASVGSGDNYDEKPLKTLIQAIVVELIFLGTLAGFSMGLLRDHKGRNAVSGLKVADKMRVW